MTYEQALHYWFGRINYEVRSPKASDLNLDRMRALLEQLDGPQRHWRCIHIAGSKGKGSTSATLATILTQAGYRTGLYTSPHLERVEERIQIDGQAIDPEELALRMEEVAAAAAHVDRRQPPHSIGVTFFEICTALAFLHFTRRRVEVAVLEVGLGGRFDATNVCDPLLALITSISYDHTQQLGNTLGQIAFEKAGIIKRGRPVLSSARADEARAVIERISRQRRAPLEQLDRDFHYRYEAGSIGAEHDVLPRVQVTTRTRQWPALPLRLLGDHQAANAALAVAAVDKLRTLGLTIADEAVARGLLTVEWPARLEIVQRQPLVILDCAHNLASAEALVQTLQTTLAPATSANGVKRQHLLVFAGSNDKDLEGMLRMLAPLFTHVFATRYHTNPRSVPPEQLGEMLQRQGYTAFSLHEQSAAAWAAARRAAGAHDVICITGSVFLAGELRPLLYNPSPQPAGS